LEPPHLPVAVTSCHDLVVVTGVKSKPAHRLVSTLLGEVVVGDHPARDGIVLLRLLFTSRLNPGEDKSLHITIAIGVRGNEQT
jgi:hypothetical protein